MRLLAGTTHARRLSALHAMCFREAWNEESMSSLLDQPGTFAGLADDESGFILMRVAGDEAEVLTLAVAPAARRRGIALGLVVEAAEAARERGATKLFLEVSRGNFPAISLYKRLGLSEVGVRKGYYTSANAGLEDALVLQSPLPLLRVGKSMQLG